ncbi:GrpB family protein [Actinopolymorpha pittospori]|uniref:GrpB-like predicted nucleotidyltransferase (UPF0157 family) n=1 Tax=Actinopolymorpha pittospori TaxID=648752 RepID=A0A927N686_9ACTN|nr:GrpB family protein [Actinopolymorpha pittospori]MBE1612914.1 GrpB-like predicted nucleotidyltransferase (UPF0157 family) [Actinopolymorpha pittospori]
MTDPNHTASTFRHAAVRIVEYDPTWPTRYAEEATLLTETLGSRLLRVEHVGSTSVPGMPAKPIIDILAAVAGYDDFPTVVTDLEKIGYLYTPESESDDPDRRVFRKGPDDMTRLRTHHLHVTEAGSPYWQRIVAFRDHLRRTPEVATAYADLKKGLAAEHAREPRSYTAGKHDFVTTVERITS